MIMSGYGKSDLDNERNKKKCSDSKRVVSGEITVLEAKELLGLSERQVYRLKSSFKLRGVRGLIHGNKGKVSSMRLDTQVSVKIIELAKREYKRYNDSYTSGTRHWPAKKEKAQ